MDIVRHSRKTLLIIQELVFTIDHFSICEMVSIGNIDIICEDVICKFIDENDSTSVEIELRDLKDVP